MFSWYASLFLFVDKQNLQAKKEDFAEAIYSYCGLRRPKHESAGEKL